MISFLELEVSKLGMLSFLPRTWIVRKPLLTSVDVRKQSVPVMPAFRFKRPPKSSIPSSFLRSTDSLTFFLELVPQETLSFPISNPALKMKLTTNLLAFIALASVPFALAAPIAEDKRAAEPGYGNYGSYPPPVGGYGKYGGYGSYKRVEKEKRAAEPEPEPAPKPGYGNYGSYPPPPGGYGKYGGYGSYKRVGKEKRDAADYGVYGSYGSYDGAPVPPNPPPPAGGYGNYGDYPEPEGGYGSYGAYKMVRDLVRRVLG